MRDPSDNVHPLRQHLLLLRPPKRRRFIVIDEWIANLPVTPGAKLAYGALLSFTNALMPTRARDVVAFTQRTQRSFRRHLLELERAGLIVRSPQFRAGRRLENRYDFLWQPTLPEELKGAAYAPNVRAPADAHDRSRGDIEEQNRVTSASEQLRTAKISMQQAGKSPESREIELPAELASSLEKAAPGQVVDCLRVVREACAELPPERARAVILNALRRLIQRCERGTPNNPPGLLRMCLVPEAIAAEKDMIAKGLQLRAEITQSDASLANARSGLEILQRMLAREIAVNAYVEHVKASFGCEPDDASSFVVNDPDLAELLGTVRTLQRAVRVAREKGDALKVNRIQEDLYRLERRLDEYLQKRRARVS